MITKLTAENAELYYAPRFAEITAALQAAGKDIEIRSLEDYFLYLTDIAELKIGAKEVPNAYLLVLPADEEIFAIDANTRAISVPAFVKKNGIGVYGDHRAEMIVLTVDRYFDHEDFLNDKIVINWNFTPAGGKVPLYEENQAAAAFAPNEELNPGYITFGFIITKDMTPEKGTLTFSVTIYDDKSNEIVYSFNTLTATVNINDTITLTDMSVIKNDADNYVGRLTNSVYTNNTIAPIGTPIWKSGEKIQNEYTGLDATAYFNGYEDLTNEYINGVLLKAYATVTPATADVVYKWSFSPVDGTVATVRDFETINLASDYVQRELPASDDGSVFYQKDEIGNIKTSEPLTFAEAKAIADAAGVETDNHLPLTVRRLITAPNDVNAEDCQFNQDHVAFEVPEGGNKLYIYSTEELRSFASTNEAQGSGKWIGIDINTGLDSIIGAFWGDYELTQADEDEAASVGLPAGHIIFWVKADVIALASRTIRISAPGKDETTIEVKYAGVKEDARVVDSEMHIENHVNVPEFYVRGTSYRALSAGNYQVVAQARVSAGENYEKVLDGAELKVNTEYYAKVNGEIDKLNPLVNSDAAEAQANGVELYVLVSAARNSAPIESSVLSVPPAVQPVVVLSVATEFQFSDEVAKDPDFDDSLRYVYIDNTQIPEIVATVSVPSDDARDAGGAFAAQLVQTSEAIPTYEEIEQKIADHDLEFIALPSDGKFIFRPTEIEEGEYVVRAINRRNATYSVSENSDSINTSFVAPAVNKLDVFAVLDDDNTITALQDGVRPQSGIVNFEINRNHPTYEFQLVDNSDNFEEAECTYYIEEVEYNEDTGEVHSRTPEETEGDIFNPEEDVRQIEVIQDENENNVYQFSITGDPGYYRILTKNRYHGTIHTSYTDVFGIVARS